MSNATPRSCQITIGAEPVQKIVIASFALIREPAPMAADPDYLDELAELIEAVDSAPGGEAVDAALSALARFLDDRAAAEDAALVDPQNPQQWRDQNGNIAVDAAEVADTLRSFLSSRAWIEVVTEAGEHRFYPPAQAPVVAITQQSTEETA